MGVKVVLTGLQEGCTNFYWFLCEWENRARDKRYVVKNWLRRECLMPEIKNIKVDSLVQSAKIFLSP